MSLYRILAVEAATDNEGFLRHALEGKYELLVARDAADAIAMGPKAEPDAIVLDFDDPVAGGLELCQAIRKHPLCRGTQIFFLSVTQDKEIIRKCYECGTTLFIARPVTADRLIKNLELSLTRNGAPKPKKTSLAALLLERRTAHPPAAAKPLEASLDDDRSEQMWMASATAVATGEPEPGTTRARAAARPRVMVVDDDREIVGLIDLALRDGYEIVSAENGMDALDRLADFEPDLFLVDVMMPKMNGFQFCQSIRANATFKDCPVLFLTAKTHRKDREYADKVGADAFITKPFNISTLEAFINALSRKPDFHVRTKSMTLAEIQRGLEVEDRERQQKRKRREREKSYEDMNQSLPE